MENAGAVSVIVYDNINEGFIHMATDHTYPRVTVPAVFITKREGEYLDDLITEVPLVLITSASTELA